MPYKRSIFNVEIDRTEEDKILLYNTYSGTFGIMDKETQEIYYALDGIKEVLLDNGEMEQNFQVMIKYGYVVDSEMDELARFKLERLNMSVRNNVLNLTIAPTMACNMRCPYCYEDKNGKVMTEETKGELIRFVEARLVADAGIRTLSVNWYGGEPLLQKRIIYDLSEEFIQISQKYKVNYDASIITNGVLLDRETAKKLHDECSVNRVQITIDGMPEIHNKRRIFANGGGSFDIIINNIQQCRDFFDIYVRMNVDRFNEQDVKNFLKFSVEELKWDDNPQIYIAPVDNYTERCTHSSTACFAHSEFAQIANNFQQMNYKINRDRVKNEFFPHRSVIHCGAEQQNTYVIDPEGNYYNCWMLIGDAERRSGHISEPFAVTTKYYEWLNSEIPHKCEACEYLPMCAAGCGYFRIIKKEEPNCTTTFYSYKNTLRLAYKDYIKQKDKV